MRPYQKEIILFLMIGLVAFAAFYICSNVFKTPYHGQIDAHAWLHQQISITAEQESKLTDIEKAFAEKQNTFQKEIHIGNLELAAAMLEDKTFSKRVAAAVERIHHAQGGLQKATIEHIFNMQTVLTPQQAEKLNKLAADALIQNP